MKVNDLILKLTELRNEFGNLDVEYDITSSMDNETKIENVNCYDNDNLIVLSAY